jgi:hypothetical protein
MPEKKSTIFLVLLICPILIIGCDFKGILKKQLEKITPEEVDKFARDYINILRKGDIEQAEKLIEPQIVDSETRSGLQKCVDFLKEGELISVEIVGVNIFRTKDKSRNNLTYQLEFKDRWLLATVIVDDISGKQQVVGFHVDSLPKSLEEINAFTFVDKSFRHYIILLLAIGTPIFIIYTIVLCARTKVRRKWLWIIFILIGFGKLSFNWTSGQMKFLPLAFQLFSAAAFKGGLYAPWVISVSLPLGALLFIKKRRKIRQIKSTDASKKPD